MKLKFESPSFTPAPSEALYLFCFVFKYVFIGFETEVEREKKHGCERETLIGFLPHVPQLEIKPATWLYALTGN